MDKLYRFGLSQVFLIIALSAIKKYQITTKYSHLDSTSIHLHGEYNQFIHQTKAAETAKENPIIITKGYSRDPSGSPVAHGGNPQDRAGSP